MFEENSPEARQKLGEERCFGIRKLVRKSPKLHVIASQEMVKQMHELSGVQVKQIIAKRMELSVGPSALR